LTTEIHQLIFHLRAPEVIKTTFLLFVILIATNLNLRSQSDSCKWKIGVNGIVSTGYGNQGLTTPFWETKTMLGLQVRKSKTSIYSQIGFSGLFGPLYSLHLETGIRSHFLSVDHSVNWHKILRDPVIKYNHNINLGIHIPLNKSRGNTTTLSVRGGASLSTFGHSASYPMILDGYNVEIRLVVLLYES
jgi:hypothetical protein